MERFAICLLTFALCLVGLTTAAQAERRVALLIGNAAYHEAALRNPVNDVAAMKAALTGAGFDTVIARTDLDRTGMLQALRSFEDAVGGADIGVVFYSGHGIEFRGQNYCQSTFTSTATGTSPTKPSISTACWRVSRVRRS